MPKKSAYYSSGAKRRRRANAYDWVLVEDYDSFDSDDTSSDESSSSSSSSSDSDDDMRLYRGGRGGRGRGRGGYGGYGARGGYEGYGDRGGFGGAVGRGGFGGYGGRGANADPPAAPKGKRGRSEMEAILVDNYVFPEADYFFVDEDGVEFISEPINVKKPKVVPNAVIPNDVSPDTPLVYIIKHSSKLLDFEPSSATLVKVGYTTMRNLYNRFEALQDKAYRVIPELFVNTPCSELPFMVLHNQLARRQPITDYDELEDVVAVLTCEGDKSEALFMESQVRSLIGGATNDAMKVLMKSILRHIPNTDLHSYDMVVCDLKLLYAIRKEWIDGRLRTFEQLWTSPLISKGETPMTARLVQFHLSTPRSAYGIPGERKAWRIDGYASSRIGRPESSPHYTAFGLPGPGRLVSLDISVKFESDYRGPYKYDGHYLPGQVRTWPTLATLQPPPSAPPSSSKPSYVPAAAPKPVASPPSTPPMLTTVTPPASSAAPAQRSSGQIFRHHAPSSNAPKATSSSIAALVLAQKQHNKS